MSVRSHESYADVVRLTLERAAASARRDCALVGEPSVSKARAAEIAVELSESRALADRLARQREAPDDIEGPFRMDTFNALPSEFFGAIGVIYRIPGGQTKAFIGADDPVVRAIEDLYRDLVIELKLLPKSLNRLIETDYKTVNGDVYYGSAFIGEDAVFRPNFFIENRVCFARSNPPSVERYG